MPSVSNGNDLHGINNHLYLALVQDNGHNTLLNTDPDLTQNNNPDNMTYLETMTENNK